MKLYTFEEAIKKTIDNKRILLLGNGFSRALFDEIFSYDSLLDKANFEKLSKFAKRSFDCLATTDFEHVIKSLQESAKLTQLYSNNNEMAELLKSDAEGIKRTLVETLSKNHPEDPSSISSEQYESCRSFLKCFSKAYTLNYDLLLYWVYMHFIDDPSKKIDFNDGFSHPDGEKDTEYVVWGEAKPYSEKIYYLHGALHLFNSSNYLRKITWNRTGIKLKSQIEKALSEDYYPLVVSEGTSKQKYAHIRKNDYLSKCYRSFKTMSKSNILFTYGLSLSDNDEHILDAIRKSGIQEIWIGLYSGLNSRSGKRAQQKMESISLRRKEKSPLNVNYFDAGSAKVWG